MSHSDLKAKDALSNFSAAVSNAQSMLQQDQERLAHAKGELATKQDAVNTVERQCSETLEKISELEGRRAQLQKQRELREADQEEQNQHLTSLQLPRKELEADAAAAEEQAQQIQSDYTDVSLDLQQKLLSKLRDEDCGQLERQLERKNAEKRVVSQRIQRIEASLAKLQEPAAGSLPTSAPTSANNSQSANPTTTTNNNNHNSTNQRHHDNHHPEEEAAADFQEKEDELKLKQLDQDLAEVRAKREALEAEKKQTMARFETRIATLKQDAQETDSQLEEKARRLQELENQYYDLMEYCSTTACGRCHGPLLPAEEEGQGSQAVSQH